MIVMKIPSTSHARLLNGAKFCGTGAGISKNFFAVRRDRLFGKQSPVLFAGQAPELFLHDAVLERVERDDGRSTAGEKNAVEVVERAPHILELAVREDAKRLERARRRIEAATSVRSWHRVLDHIRKLAACLDRLFLHPFADRVRDAPRISLFPVLVNDFRKVFLGKLFEEGFHGCRIRRVGHHERLVAPEAEPPSGTLEMFRREPEVEKKFVRRSPADILENLAQRGEVRLDYDHPRIAREFLRKPFCRLGIPIKDQKFSALTNALEKRLGMAATAAGAIDKQLAGIEFKGGTYLLEKNGDMRHLNVQ